LAKTKDVGKKISNPLTNCILHMLRTYKIDEVTLSLFCLETFPAALLKCTCFWQPCLGTASVQVSFVVHQILSLVKKCLWIRWLFTLLFWYSGEVERKQASCLRHWRQCWNDGKSRDSCSYESQQRTILDLETRGSSQRLEWEEDVGRTNDVSELGQGEDPGVL